MTDKEKKIIQLMSSIQELTKLEKGEKYSKVYRQGLYHGIVRGWFKVKSVKDLSLKDLDYAIKMINDKIHKVLNEQAGLPTVSKRPF